MGKPPLHLVKLCVGAEGVADLAAWWERTAAEAASRGADPRPVHVTRMWPRREAELLRGGSLYWVFKGVVLARQAIRGLEPREGGDGVRRCAILLAPEIVRTAPQPRRPFQGWRYLEARDAPRDLPAGPEADALPAGLMAELDAVGVI